MKKLLLIALLMLTIVFAAVACKDDTTKPAETTVDAGTIVESTTTVEPGTTAEPETTDTIVPETTVPETTVPETEPETEPVTEPETEPETEPAITPSRGTNVALGAGVVGWPNYIESFFNPAFLTDGIYESLGASGTLGWCSQTSGYAASTENPVILDISLDNYYTFDQIVLKPMQWEKGEAFPRDYELLVSDDAVNWTTVVVANDVDAGAESDTTVRPVVHDLDQSVSAKYLRVLIYEYGEGKTYAQIGEIEIYYVGPKTFKSDVNANFDMNGASASYDILATNDPILNYFKYFNAATVPLRVMGPYSEDLYGSPCWYIADGAYVDLSRPMTFDYAFTIDVLLTNNDVKTSGFFVRSAPEMVNEGFWCGYGGSDGSYGGSGIGFTVKYNAQSRAEALIMDIRSNPVGNGAPHGYNDGVPWIDYTHTYYEFPITSDKITIADDGDTVYVIADGALLATIEISGTKAYKFDSALGGYPSWDIPEGVIASTAKVNLADGSSETIENVACSAGYGTLGIACRAGYFAWAEVSVDYLENIVVPAWTFKSDVLSNFPDPNAEAHRVDILDADIGQFFTFKKGAGSNICAMGPFNGYNPGSAWYNNDAGSYTSLTHDPIMDAYVYTVDVTDTIPGTVCQGGLFVRGIESMTVEGNFWGRDGSANAFAGSGIYFDVLINGDDITLYMTVKHDAVDWNGTAWTSTFQNTVYAFPVNSSKITIADDGNTLYVVAGDELICTVAISGTQDITTWEGRELEHPVASTAVITFADGTFETIENVACSADAGTLGMAFRSAAYAWSGMSLDFLANYVIPSFTKITTDETTYGQGQPINVTAIGFGSEWVGLFLKSDFEAGNTGKANAIYCYDLGMMLGGTSVNILTKTANKAPEYNAYLSVPEGDYVVAVLTKSGTVIDSTDITVSGIYEGETTPGTPSEPETTEPEPFEPVVPEVPAVVPSITEVTANAEYTVKGEDGKLMILVAADGIKDGKIIAAPAAYAVMTGEDITFTVPAGLAAGSYKLVYVNADMTVVTDGPSKDITITAAP